MITLYNNPLCIFHKRPNLWWHYWQLTVASVLWFILIKAFIGPLFTVWRRAGWGFLRGRPFLLLPWIVSCQDDFEKLKHNVAPAGDLAIDHLNHVVSGLNTAGIYLLSFQNQNFLLSCLLIIISKLLHTMFTNISTGTSTKISHYHIIWPLIICSMNSANSPLPFHLADSTSEASFQFLIANTIFFLITFSFIFSWISFHS